jgi:hypothetical protein
MLIKESHKIILLILWALIFLIHLPQCVKQTQQEQSPVSQTPTKTSFINKHQDISIPLGFTHVDNSPAINSTSTWLHYKGPGPLARVIKFYKQDLERLGWAIKDLSSVSKGVLVCTKTQKDCVLFIYPKNPTANNQTPLILELFIKENIKEKFS